MRHSTGKPTKEEEARIIAAKEGPCVCCFIQLHRGLIDDEDVSYQNDYNHCKSGNKRRGHMAGFGVCLWHHRGIYFPEHSRAHMEDWYGPSIMSGSRKFHEYFGSDDYLIDLQTKIIECKHEA